MTTAQDALNWMIARLGTAEWPPHSNRTAIGAAFGFNGQPWCAETVSEDFFEIGMPMSGWLAPCEWAHGFASAEGLRSAFIRHGLALPANQAQAGDVSFVSDGSEGPGRATHTFFVGRNRGDGTVDTLEGNFADRLAAYRRPISTLLGVGRPPYAGSGPSIAPVHIVAPPALPAGFPIHLGSAGNPVVRWQRALNVLASDQLVVDGAFGQNTLIATENWQRFFKLQVDGVVGANTWGVAAYVAGQRHTAI